MDERNKTLQAIWQQYLAAMPRLKVNQVMEQLGLPKTVAKKMDDESARKAVFGLITRLDDQALAGVPPFLASI